MLKKIAYYVNIILRGDYMGGTIVVKEDRGVVDKFQIWYKEKMIDTNLSQKLEKDFSNAVNVISTISKTKDTIGLGIVTFMPEASIYAPLVATLIGVKEKMFELGKNIAIKAKRGIEAIFFGVDGSNKDISVPDLDITDVLYNVFDSKNTVDSFIDEVEKEGKSL